jgi:uncharacterized protein (DUF58 family)
MRRISGSDASEALPSSSVAPAESESGVSPELLRKVRQIEIRTRRLVAETLAGQYHSAFKGQGMDFDEVREYQPGDEVRTIDWNVTARMNHPFVKKFREERELTVMLVVDLSGSGRFGSGQQSKRALMAELAAVLAFSAIRNQDKVGLMLFTETVEKFVPPAKGRRHVLRVVRDVLFFKPEFTGTNTNGALDFLNKVLPHRAVVVVVSDFLGETNPGRAAVRAHLRRKVLHSETLAAPDRELAGTIRDAGRALLASAVAPAVATHDTYALAAGVYLLFLYADVAVVAAFAALNTTVAAIA